jgi:acyl carrier protein phosphodiesterase
MNFLAHQLLSLGREKVRVGNFLGDFKKGKDFGKLEAEIVFGIQLHRNIDWFTDNHPIVKKGLDILRPELKKYCGVAMDLIFDYFLACNWKKYSDTDLNEFSMETYQILERHSDILGEKGKLTLFYMKKNNWLLNYSSWEGISQSFFGLSRRTKFASNLEQGPELLKEHNDALAGVFEAFFPELKLMVKEKGDDYFNKVK